MTAVQEALAGNETASTALRAVECRSSTCRVEIVDDGTGKLAMAVPLFILQLGKTLPYAMVNQVDQGNGAKTMILYMSR